VLSRPVATSILLQNLFHLLDIVLSGVGSALSSSSWVSLIVSSPTTDNRSIKGGLDRNAGIRRATTRQRFGIIAAISGSYLRQSGHPESPMSHKRRGLIAPCHPLPLMRRSCWDHLVRNARADLCPTSMPR
jgi:hypothetical protein